MYTGQTVQCTEITWNTAARYDYTKWGNQSWSCPLETMQHLTTKWWLQQSKRRPSWNCLDCILTLKNWMNRIKTMFMGNQNHINCELEIKRLKIVIFWDSGRGRRRKRKGRGMRCEKERKKEKWDENLNVLGTVKLSIYNAQFLIEANNINYMQYFLISTPFTKRL